MVFPSSRLFKVSLVLITTVITVNCARKELKIALIASLSRQNLSSTNIMPDVGVVEVNDSNSDGDGDFFPALDVSLLPKVRHPQCGT